jgi:predicted TPR repeat methyltransferase
VIVATDTLVYFGDLSPFIKGVALRLKQSGHCVLTVEKGLGEDYQLHFSGRYRHSFDYIQRLAWEYGLWVSRATQINLRKGGGGWVQGLIMVLEHQ